MSNSKIAGMFFLVTIAVSTGSVAIAGAADKAVAKCTRSCTVDISDGFRNVLRDIQGYESGMDYEDKMDLNQCIDAARFALENNKGFQSVRMRYQDEQCNKSRIFLNQAKVVDMYGQPRK